MITIRVSQNLWWTFSVTNLGNLGQDQTQSEFPKFVMENGWLWVENLGGLGRIRHDQGFPNLSPKIAGWGWIFCEEFGKSGKNQKRSRFPKLVTENRWLRLDFLGWILKIWTVLDMIRVFQISYGHWLAEGGFSVKKMGNLDRIRYDKGVGWRGVGTLDRNSSIPTQQGPRRRAE